MYSLSFALENQLSFSKALETWLTHLAALVPSTEAGKIPGQPELSRENAKAVTTGGSKTTRDPPYPNHAGKGKGSRNKVGIPQEDNSDIEEPIHEKSVPTRKASGGKITPQELFDAYILPFPQHNRKSYVGEQFTRFMEII